ncbi:MAG: DUF502 domain-containing protein [Candidatus Omnitrophica bacterium]|nr:DUF502 domain-containing protein [Candidatus Omnitrophota bacterium]
MKGTVARWRANFFAGLAIVLPAVISIAVVVWLFGTVSTITDTLLFFLPKSLTHQKNGDGLMYWYWSVVAFLFAGVLVGLVGQLARYYLGKKLIQWVDLALLKVPLLNKIYSTLKQVNEAFTSNQKSAFKDVVLVQFPRPDCYSLGFITCERFHEVEVKTGKKVVCVFVPTTPNPTSGFLVMVPETDIIKLDVSVAEGVKLIISLGSIAPGYVPSLVSPLIPKPSPAISDPQAAISKPQSTF